MRTHAIALAFAIVLLCHYASAQWLKQNSGTSRSLNGVYFTDAKTGTVVGDSGIILRTTDGGATWMRQQSGTMQPLKNVQFVGAILGWAVGDSGIIIYTTNGGASWGSQNSGTADQLSGVSFTDAMTGWVVGGKGTILHTTNGGANWTSVNTDSVIYLESIYFINRDTGFAVGDSVPAGGKILKTTNGGLSWDRHVVWESLSNSQLVGLESTERCLALPIWLPACVQFTDDFTGWIAGVLRGIAGYAGWINDGTICNTTNAGVTWSWKPDVPDAAFTSCHFVDLSTGWVVGETLNGPDTAAIWFTTDAGKTWNTQFHDFPHRTLRSIHFVGQMNGWVVGDGGTILHTMNGGVASVEGEQKHGVPRQYLLSQNYPNPFNPTTKIQFTIVDRQLTIVKVYDVLGRDVATLVNEVKQPGTYTVEYYGSNLASGVYFYRLQAGDFTQTKRLLLLK